MGQVMRGATRGACGSTPELDALAQLATVIPVREGTVLARQGGPCREFALLAEGTAVAIRDRHEIARLDAGQSFGEIGLVRGVPNPVTIVACTSVTLMVMNVGEFRSAHTTMPAFRDRVEHDLERRLVRWVGPSTPDDYTLAS